MEMQVSKDAAASSSSYYEAVKSDYCLCLAIHAPRKGIVEVSFSGNSCTLSEIDRYPNPIGEPNSKAWLDKWENLLSLSITPQFHVESIVRSYHCPP